MLTSRTQPAIDGGATQMAGPEGEALVSVGIPTFNRPDGLRRTLKHITEQSYRNLEILVSDNCSTDPRVSEVLDEFKLRDRRITCFRQPANIGPTENFRFLLRTATGKYFMWAADDDEWEPSFVERCIDASSDDCSIMCGFETVNRVLGTKNANRSPNLNPQLPTYVNAKEYLRYLPSTLFYALHPRENLQFFLNGPMFDFYDCYAVLRLCLYHRFRTISPVLHRAGIDSVDYQIKRVNGTGRPGLRYWPFFVNSASAIVRCYRLRRFEKAILLVMLSRKVIQLRRHHGQS